MYDNILATIYGGIANPNIYGRISNSPLPFNKRKPIISIAYAPSLYRDTMP